MTRDQLPEKPKRAFSRGLVLYGAIAPAWLAWAYAMWIGREMAAIVVPSCVLLIAGALGIYQGVGHADLRASLLAGRSARSRRGRAAPTGEDEPHA